MEIGSTTPSKISPRSAIGAILPFTSSPSILSESIQPCFLSTSPLSGISSLPLQVIGFSGQPQQIWVIGGQAVLSDRGWLPLVQLLQNSFVWVPVAHALRFAVGRLGRFHAFAG